MNQNNANYSWGNRLGPLADAVGNMALGAGGMMLGGGGMGSMVGGMTGGGGTQMATQAAQDWWLKPNT